MKFTETQKLHQPWIFVVLGIIFAIFAWAFIQQIILGEPFGNNPAPDSILIISFLIPVLLLAALLFGRMVTRVDEEGIYIKVKPFMFKWKYIPFTDITSYHSTEYSPIGDYGGWGIRLTFKGSRAYNARGNKGVKLMLKKGRHIMIGSAKPDILEKAIYSLSGLEPLRPKES